MRIYYIGSFPPVYGGVTIKNKYLFDALSQELDIRKIDMNRVKRGSVKEVLHLAWALLTGKQFVIGLAGQKNRRMFTGFLSALKRNAMARSVLIVMGGSVDDVVAAGPDFLQKANCYRRIFVELPAMEQKLTAAGLTNAAIYPNGRPRPQNPVSLAPAGETLRCVFFSIIRPEKGVDLILEAAKQLPQVQFHFYGEIQPSYEDTFRTGLEGKPNLFYHGVFTGSSEDVYQELGQYDLLLLPTRWKGEGLPGILIEAKIAGVPAIVTDHNYNREIVVHGTDGIVLEENTADALCATLALLDADRAQLQRMKQESRTTAEKYLIDVCVQDVLHALRGG